MGRQRQQATAQQSLAHQPFRALKQIVTKPASAPAPVRKASPRAVEKRPLPPDDADLFLQAVAGVKRLGARARERVAHPRPASPARAVTAPDAEAFAELCDLVAGSAPFDISASDEYIEGTAIGVDPRLLRRLRHGEFAYQAHLDLHGMIVDEAREALAAFLTHAAQSGKRCVLIIHGRGRNSRDQIPVLKSHLTRWLARGPWNRLVLAFASARPCDGGVGALYVLLRRQHRGKRAIRVTNGAQW